MTTTLVLVPVIGGHVVVVHVAEFVDVRDWQWWIGSEGPNDATPLEGRLEGLLLALPVDGTASSSDRLDVFRLGASDDVTGGGLRLPFSAQTAVFLLVLTNLSAGHVAVYLRSGLHTDKQTPHRCCAVYWIHITRRALLQRVKELT